MPELRKDPLTRTWVTLAPERKLRPQYLERKVQIEEPPPGGCPFCEGNERMTTPEVFALRKKGTAPNGPGWRLRVVPNKFPALRVEGELDKRGEGLYDKMNGIGAHEVVIETPEHDLALADMEAGAIRDIFSTFKQRILDLRQDIRFKYIQVFKNQGAPAGATIPHPHSQVVALPVIPARLSEKLDTARRHFRQKERCIFCDILRHEVEKGDRVLAQNGEFIVLAPFAPRLPFELLLLPRAHGAAFQDSGDESLGSLAEILKETLGQIDGALEKPAFNLVLQNSPFVEDCADCFHWHLEIMPVVTGTGGFEIGTHSYINPIPPEESVKVLKSF